MVALVYYGIGMSMTLVVEFSLLVKFMFSKKATKIEKIFTVNLTLKYLVNVKSTVKIWSIFVAFLENMNFIRNYKRKGAH